MNRSDVERNVRTVASELGVRFDWLLTGEGPMRAEEGGTHVEGMVKEEGAAFEPELASEVADADEHNGYVLNNFLEGGPGGGPARTSYPTQFVVKTPKPLQRSWTGGRIVPNGYWTRVQGESMEPWLSDQEPIFVEPCNHVMDMGRYVLWLDDDEAEVVKRVQRIGKNRLKISSDNPDAESYTVRAVGEDLYEREDDGAEMKIQVKGRVLYPRDRNPAFMKLMMRQLTDAIQAAFRP